MKANLLRGWGSEDMGRIGWGDYLSIPISRREKTFIFEPKGIDTLD